MKECKAVTILFQKRTYPRCTIRSKALCPVVTAHEEESSHHDEDPDDHVDGIEDVVETHGLLDPSSQDDSHEHLDEEAQEVRVRLAWGKHKVITGLNLRTIVFRV